MGHSPTDKAFPFVRRTHVRELVTGMAMAKMRSAFSGLAVDPGANPMATMSASSDTTSSWGLPGDIPVTGVWNGDGKDDIGIFRRAMVSGAWIRMGI